MPLWVHNSEKMPRRLPGHFPFRPPGPTRRGAAQRKADRTEKTA